MKKLFLPLLLLLSLPLLAVFLIPGVSAQKAAATASAAQTPKEQETLMLLDQNQLIKARRYAEEILAENPNSLVGLYVMGRVLYQAEGSLPSAMYHLGRARQLYEDTWATYPRPEG